MEHKEDEKILYTQLGIYSNCPFWLAIEYMGWVLHCDSPFKIIK